MARHVRRGVAAGLIAGLLSGLVGLALGEPALQAAIDLEATAPGETEVVSRALQRVGLVLGNGLVGIGVGALFGVAAAWAIGRVEGDAWTRSLKLGAAAAGAMVLLPAVKYPAVPPGAGDPETVSLRTALFLGLALIGILLALAGWAGARQMATTGRPRAFRQALIGGALLVAGGLVVAIAPAVPVGVPEQLPAEVLWTFRLGAIATQLTLYAGTAVIFGLLSQEPAHQLRIPPRASGLPSSGLP